MIVPTGAPAASAAVPAGAAEDAGGGDGGVKDKRNDSVSVPLQPS